jgi:hypothetical protein
VTDANRDPEHKTEAIKEHEGVDAETVLEDVEELFAPDNTEIPPPNPDQPPPAD